MIAVSKEEQSYERLKALPTVTVSVLQSALQRWFTMSGTRNLDEILGAFRTHGVTWTTAPKVVVS